MSSYISNPSQAIFSGVWKAIKVTFTLKIQGNAKRMLLSRFAIGKDKVKKSFKTLGFSQSDCIFAVERMQEESIHEPSFPGSVTDRHQNACLDLI